MRLVVEDVPVALAVGEAACEVEIILADGQHNLVVIGAGAGGDLEHEPSERLAVVGLPVEYPGPVHMVFAVLVQGQMDPPHHVGVVTIRDVEGDEIMRLVPSPASIHIHACIDKSNTLYYMCRGRLI